MTILLIQETNFESLIDYLKEKNIWDWFFYIFQSVPIILVVYYWKLLSRWFTGKKTYLDNYIIKNPKDIKFKGYIPLQVSDQPIDEADTLEDQNIDQEFMSKKVISDTTLNKYLVKRRSFLITGYSWSDPDIEKVVLIGGAGTGKTSALYKLYNALYHPFSRMPKVILHRLTGDATDGWGTNQKGWTILKDEATVFRSKCVLLLDGFDEYIEILNKNNENALNELECIFEYFTGFKAIVVATRPISGLVKEDDKSYLWILKMNPETIKKSIKKKYRRQFPFILNYNSQYLNTITRITENDNFLLNRVCRRPLLLRYVDAFTNDYYSLTEDELSEELGFAIEGYKLKSKILRERPFIGKKTFLKEVRKEARSTTPGALRDWFKFEINQKRLCERAKHDPLDNDAAIYWYITRQALYRESDKRKLGEDEQYAYCELMDSICAEVANNISERQSTDLNISANRFTSIIDKFCQKYISKEPLGKKAQRVYNGLEKLGLLEVSSKSDHTKLKLGSRGLFKYHITKSSDDRTLRFTHKSFYDYFLASYIFRNPTCDSSMCRILELKLENEVWKFYKNWIESQIQLDETIEKDINLENDYLESITAKTLKHCDVDLSKSSLPPPIIFRFQPVVRAQLHINSDLDALQKLITIYSIFISNQVILKKAIKFNFDRILKISPIDIFIEHCQEKWDSDVMIFTGEDLIASFGDEVLINLYLDYYPDILQRRTNNANMSMLMLACHFNNHSVVRTMLISYKEDIMSWIKMRSNSGWTSLMCASRYNSPEVIELLLDHYPEDKNSYLEERNNRGWNALMHACNDNNTEAVEILLQAYEGNKNEWLIESVADNRTALMMASDKNSYKTVKLLIDAYSGDKDAWLRRRSASEQASALAFACYNSTYHTIKLLLDTYQGNKSNWLSEKSGIYDMNALMVVCRANSFKAIKLVFNAFNGNKDNWLEERDNQGNNALMLSCLHNTPETVKFLLKAYSGDIKNWVNKKNDLGWTALALTVSHNPGDLQNDRAILNKHRKMLSQDDDIIRYDKENAATIVKLLLEHGAKIISPLPGISLRANALFNGHDLSAELL